MTINRNQKSVLTLFLVFFVGIMLSDPATVVTPAALVFWIILGCWFYGVRDKPKADKS